MTSLAVRLIGGAFGGVIGGYVTGKIYDHFNSNDQNIKNNQSIQQIKEPSQDYENRMKFRDVKSFEEILNIQIEEQLKKNKENLANYNYDNENGNTIELKKETIEYLTSNNYATNTNSFYDDIYNFYRLTASR